MTKLVLAATTAAIAPITLALVLDTPAQLADKLHAYYVAQFDNLEPTKNGNFGTSRIEFSDIKAHVRDGGLPGGSKPPHYTVVIFGNHGKPLGKGIDRRYQAWRERSPEDVNARPPQLDEKVLLKAADAFKNPAWKHFVVAREPYYVDLRPVRLTKKECLNCHAGMKQGDAVALIAYSIYAK